MFVDVAKDDIEKILRKRTFAQCQGTAASAVGKRRDWTCQNTACVGGIFCSQHGGKGPTRYIRPSDLPTLIEELSSVLIPQEVSSSA